MLTWFDFNWVERAAVTFAILCAAGWVFWWAFCGSVDRISRARMDGIMRRLKVRHETRVAAQREQLDKGGAA